VRDNLSRVLERVERAAARAGRNPSEVALVAISKTRSAEEVAEVAAGGLRRFGENRVQEAAEKIPRVAELRAPGLEWHLVGTLQRNKIRAALELFAILQSVDSLRLAEAIDQRASGRRIPVLLEVYLGDEQDRPGFRPLELHEQLPHLLCLTGLEIRGLMTVAPLGLDEQATQRVFAQVRELRDRLTTGSTRCELPELSMGMTDDFPLAIAEGATIVRIGRAIFGARTSQ
jgi:pyridoxal phosphate enzyme (YggS family)